jgi:hypothetical protein
MLMAKLPGLVTTLTWRKDGLAEIGGGANSVLVDALKGPSRHALALPCPESVRHPGAATLVAKAKHMSLEETGAKHSAK